MAKQAESEPPPAAEPEQKVLLRALGKRIKAARKKAGLTAQALGDASGVSKSFVFAVENYGANVTMDLLWRLSKELHVGVRDLLPESEWDRPAAPALHDLRVDMQRILAGVDALGQLHADVQALVARLEVYCALLDADLATREEEED